MKDKAIETEKVILKMPLFSAWHDQSRLMQVLTLPRVRNAFQVWQSYQVSRWQGRAVHRGMPIALSFEPTTSCNLRCPECPSGLRSFTRPTGMLSEQLFQRVIDEIAPTLVYLTFYFQGEPYLHPQFLQMVRYAADRNIYTATSTNAHYLSEANAERTIDSGLDRLIVSIDGTTQDTYQSYRVGGSLEKVLEGTRTLLKVRAKRRLRRPYVIFQFLVVGPNEHEIPAVRQLAKSLGVDEVKLKTAQIYDYEKGSPLIPKDPRYARYQQRGDGTYEIKNPLADHCWKMWHSCVITWDGRVVPCCFDKDAHHVLGHVGEMSFRSVWQSTPYQQFRSSLLRSRSEIDICKNCTEGTPLWV